MDADRRLRKEFHLPEGTTLLLPARALDRFILTIRNLTEAQARAILTTARNEGVKLDG